MSTSVLASLAQRAFPSRSTPWRHARPKFSTLCPRKSDQRPAASEIRSTSSLEDKYATKLWEKVQEKGLRDLEELKQLAKEKLEAERSRDRELYEDLVRKARSQSTNPVPQKAPLNYKRRDYSSPIKPLDSIIDVSKVSRESASTITKMWVAYHLSTASPPRLGAVIPSDTYREMIQHARKYPSFVLPLPKPNSSDSSSDEVVPLEMQYLQWDFVSTPTEPRLPEFLKPGSALPCSSVPPTIVMYTPLAEYQLRQSFAQPALILTHYTDLADSHNIVLMRGDITPSPTNPQKGLLTSTEAQLLILRLQQFYYSSGPVGGDDSIHKKRQMLLRQFHENPEQFELPQLLASVRDL